MEYLASYLYSTKISNYSMLNTNNIYNSLLSIFDLLQDDKQKNKFIDILIVQCGNTFINDFKAYVFRKISSHEILKYM